MLGQRLYLLAGFQSTHPHGVRQCINTTYVRVACFNPRTHTGCDTYQTLHACADSVSIHAPTRGATSIISLAWSGIEFQSTHPHGVRLICFLSVFPRKRCFNPRTHTGCDFPLFNWDKSKKGFNPRTHTGCDLKEHISINRIRIVSIHAPTRGATVSLSLAKATKQVSIHAPTRGATPLRKANIQGNQVSIHAPTRGATYRQILVQFPSGFNPRTHTGCDSVQSYIL